MLIKVAFHFSPESARAVLPLVAREKARLEAEEAGKGKLVRTRDREVTTGRLLLVCALFSGLEAVERLSEARAIWIEGDYSIFAWGAFSTWAIETSRVVNGRGLIIVADSLPLSHAGDAFEAAGKDIAEKIAPALRGLS